MGDRVKNIITVSTFVIVLGLFFFLNIYIKDEKISKSERRVLNQFPKFSINKLVNENISEEFENYAMDQFVGRDFFRKIKSFISINIFKNKDNNKMFVKDDAIYKMEYPLNENNIQKSTEKMKKIQEEYLDGMNVYYAIVPEKNYYLENDEHLKIDYSKLKKIVNENLKNMTYIDIWEGLSLQDYYRTDIHWKQEKLQNVVNTIEENMNLKTTTLNMYELVDVGEFYGTYYGQVSEKIGSDEMYILNNKTLENCVTYNLESKKIGSVYNEEKTLDKYDIFLSGATPLINIENPNASEEKELLLFRDSFGSSIAPLLVENYSKITLIDIRYISSNILKEYIEFKNQDVLFLYSALVLNQNIFK